MIRPLQSALLIGGGMLVAAALVVANTAPRQNPIPADNAVLRDDARIDVAQRSDKAVAVRDLALSVGHVLGAASGCREISPLRIKTISDAFTGAIRASTTSDRELAAMLQLFDQSVADGLRTVTSRQTDCGTANRDFADLERASLVSPTGGVNVATPAAPAQTVYPPSPAITAIPTTIAPVTSESVIRGVTDREIRFGISAPFSGSAKELGRQMKLGIDTAFNVANDAGGVHGRQLKLIAADDGYEPSRTTDTMKQLCERDQVFGVIGNVGTPTAMVAVPYALDHRMLFFGAFTGAGVLRRDPPDRYVFNYRASYTEETDAVVRYLVKVQRVPPQQIAVFAQQDAYGDAGFAGVARALRALRTGNAPILRLNYTRNTVDVDGAVAELRARKTPIKAVVMVAAYRAAAKFIEKTRPLYPGMVYTNVSFVGSTALADELMLLGPKFASGVIVTQVVPAIESYATVILQYKSALAKYFPGEAPDYVSLEGYIAASLLVEALKRAGPQPDVEKVVETLENMRDLDLGLGTLVTFGRTEHQALHKVWGTELDGSGHYQAIDLE